MGNRARKARGRQTPPSEPLDKARATSRFRQLRGRAVDLGFVPLGEIVEAKTPEDLERAINAAIIKNTDDTQN